MEEAVRAGLEWGGGPAFQLGDVSVQAAGIAVDYIAPRAASCGPSDGVSTKLDRAFCSLPAWAVYGVIARATKSVGPATMHTAGISDPSVVKVQPSGRRQINRYRARSLGTAVTPSFCRARWSCGRGGVRLLGRWRTKWAASASQPAAQQRL